MELHEAINVYHSLLTDEVGRQSQGELSMMLHRRELFFGARPLCTVLRPRFLTTDQYHHLQRALRSILPAFATAHQAAITDPTFRAQFMLYDWEEQLLEVLPGFREPSPMARMDTFFSNEGLVFTEYNAETPAAPAYNDALSDVFYGLRVMRDFALKYEVRPLPGRYHVLHALLDAYEQWGGRDRPRIAIVDWRDVPTYSEFVLFQEYFRSQGCECIIADPREFEYRDGQLLADGIIPVNIIYKRVLISELVDQCGTDHPIFHAIRDGAVCMVNPLQCKILHKKASLSVLSDERNRYLFNPDEVKTIDAYIPWTRNVEERTTVFEGREIDLIPFVSDNKDNLVLKPNDEYGGKGIVLGWEVDQHDWDEAVKVALEHPYIIQKRVPLPSEPYPSLVDGSVQIYDRMMDTNPYIWRGHYVSCCLTRLSTAALLNVTAGGGSTVPTFVIEKRD